MRESTGTNEGDRGRGSVMRTIKRHPALALWTAGFAAAEGLLLIGRISPL